MKQKSVGTRVTQIQLLRSETSFPLNLFLARLEMDPDTLICRLLDADNDAVGTEALRLLVKLLPSPGEVSIELLER